VGCAKMAEPIQMPFGYDLSEPKEACVTHSHNLANTIEPSTCGGDVA